MEKLEDDSPFKAEGEDMMPLTRVPLASGSFQVGSRWPSEEGTREGAGGAGREVVAILNKGLFLSGAPS